MERADLKKVLAGFGLTALLASVALAGCSGSQKSSSTGEQGAGTGNRQQAPAPSS
jgi:radical SAM modification target selenobiotic family peptide